MTEASPFAQPTEFAVAEPALDALRSLEDQVLQSGGGIEGVILRYGLFYGPGVGSTEFMIKLLRRRMFVLPGGGRSMGSWIHVVDGASAAVAALERAPGGSVFNVVDDRPATIGEFAEALSKNLELPKPRKVPMWMARLGGAYAALDGEVTPARLERPHQVGSPVDSRLPHDRGRHSNSPQRGHPDALTLRVRLSVSR